MPFTRVPVVHKFGIISYSQRLELQERLLKQTYQQSIQTKHIHIPHRNPLEVCEEFIQRFNNATTLEEKERYEEMARKMLERAKRRAGLRNNGSGQHVNLPLAWTELAQIAQCKGHIQEECLDILITSLDVSPLAKYHIPALFFLAETMLYWLRTETVHQPYLHTVEIKLMKMGQLVFQRLFYHHMAGQLQDHNNFKNRLFTYSDGLVECQVAYSPYPNALLSLRFIIEVSKIILADAVVESGEVKEGDHVPAARERNLRWLETTTRQLYQQEQHELGARSSCSVAVSSSVHDLSPTLWHALDVWRCTNSLSGGLREALRALLHCGLGLGNEAWVDGIMALHILAESAKTNLSALKTLLHLAQGTKTTEDFITPPHSSCSGMSDTFNISGNNDDTVHSEVSSKPNLSDIFEHSDENDLPKLFDSSACLDGFSSPTGGVKVLSSQTSGQDAVESEQKNAWDVGASASEFKLKESAVKKRLALSSREVSFDKTGTAEEKTGEKKESHLETESTGHSLPKVASAQESHQSAESSGVDATEGTGMKANAGSGFNTSRGSEASSAPTFTNLPLPEMPGINGWHWEVAFTYTDMLANICIHGSTATIQKMVLVGTGMQSLSGPHHPTLTSGHLLGAGLFDLALFQPQAEATDGGPNDWSWQIRYGAIQSLVKVVRSLAGDKAREGLCTAARKALCHANSSEKDGRVLEALKVGQVHTDIKGILGKEGSVHQLSIGARIAHGLSALYLPPLPLPVDISASKPPQHVHNQIFKKKPASLSTAKRKPVRTSLKEEIDLAVSLYEPPVDYKTRIGFDLRRIVEDQWRKELQKQTMEDEEKRRKELVQKQKEEEALQRQKDEIKLNKLLANRAKECSSTAAKSPG